MYLDLQTYTGKKAKIKKSKIIGYVDRLDKNKLGVEVMIVEILTYGLSIPVEFTDISKKNEFIKQLEVE